MSLEVTSIFFLIPFFSGITTLSFKVMEFQYFRISIRIEFGTVNPLEFDGVRNLFNYGKFAIFTPVSLPFLPFMLK